MMTWLDWAIDDPAPKHKEDTDMTAEKTLDELGLPRRIFQTAGTAIAPEDQAAFVDALATIQAATDELEEEALALKREEQDVKERKRKVRARWDELVAARAYLYGQRPRQPGDVVARPGGDK